MYIVRFDAENATLETCGGKGANLVRLTRVGFPVPRGFVIATQAYRDYVSANVIAEKIARALADAQIEKPDALESTSSQIRRAFMAGGMPPELAQEIVAAYHTTTDEQPVAVRSSATAEDLPGLSFAGQQETFLNVIGDQALLDAVKKCWAGLWSARAIGYRVRNKISHLDAALAVVVQEMISSEASGVMFTANPLTGVRDEIVIEATLGLGEPLVSGQVDPDNYVVEVARKTITQKSLGAKSMVVRARAGGGTVIQEQNAAHHQALPDAQIIELATLGKRVADEFGAPQDIEWAWAGGKWFLLQARPITTL